MSFINCSTSTTHKQENISYKVISSQGTDVSQSTSILKHQSLTSCASSVSIEHKLHFTSENELFAQYLFEQDTSSQQKCFEKMKRHYAEMQAEGEEQNYSFFGLKHCQLEEDQQVMRYFIGCWLVFMGYGSSSNKKYFMGRVKMQVGQSRAMQFARVYKNLSLLGLRCSDLLIFLLQTCRNGWQYFIREILRMEQISHSQI